MNEVVYSSSTRALFTEKQCPRRLLNFPEERNSRSSYELNEVVESSRFGTAFLFEIRCFFNRSGYRAGFFAASAANSIGLDFNYFGF